jgi:hypothetical protein
MNYGILVAEEYAGHELIDYQIVGEIDSPEDAPRMVAEYLALGPENNLLAPDRFVIIRRGQHGFYNIREVIEL